MCTGRHFQRAAFTHQRNWFLTAQGAQYQVINYNYIWLYLELFVNKWRSGLKSGGGEKVEIVQ